MNTLQIRCKFDRSDVKDLAHFTFFEGGRLMTLITGLFVGLGAALTVIAAVMAFRFRFNVYLILSVISFWAMICFYYRDIFKSRMYNGVHEIYFTGAGVEMYTPVQRTRIPASYITKCEEGRKFIIIYARHNMLLTIPKRYLTLQEGMLIRELFSQLLVRRGVFDDSYFRGERLDEAERFGAEEITEELTVVTTDSFLRDAAWVRFTNPIILGKYPIGFFIICLIISHYQGDAVGILIALSFTAIASYQKRKKLWEQFKYEFSDFSNCIRLIFYGSYFEAECGYDTVRLNYCDIMKVKDFSYSVKITVKNGVVVLPRNEELLRRCRTKSG